MDITELRIGNLIHDDLSEVAKVCKVRGGVHASVEVYENFHKGTGWTTVFKPMPIPLTEDWLKKFGFEKLPPSFINCLNPYWVKNGVVLFFTETPPVNTYLLSVGFTFEGKYYAATSRWISEVHLLQNYYFAHIGEELTIYEPTKQSEG